MTQVLLKKKKRARYNCLRFRELLMILRQNEQQFGHSMLMHKAIYKGSSNECCHFKQNKARVMNIDQVIFFNSSSPPGLRWMKTGISASSTKLTL